MAFGVGSSCQQPSLLKARGLRPLLVARGGIEAHGVEVLERARALGLRVQPEAGPGDTEGLCAAIEGAAVGAEGEADVLLGSAPLDLPTKRALFAAADGVLANSGHEPFGLVGLEVMAVGGVAFVGGTGEDYALPGQNCMVLQSNDPQELVRVFRYLRADSEVHARIRAEGPRTARLFSWDRVLEGGLFPHLHR